MKKLFLLFLISSSFLSKAQGSLEELSKLKGYETSNRIKLNYIPVDIQPGEIGRPEIPMSVLGLHYDFTLNKHFYAGVGMFAAVKGDQGGLFTLGAEIGFQQKLYRNLYFDTDFHFGGGGGYRYLVKDGAFINYNLGLKYNFKKASIGIQHSYFNFYNGSIESSRFSAFITLPTSLFITDYKNANKTYFVEKTENPFFWNRPANKNGLSIKFDHFIPTGDTKDQYLKPLTNTLYLMGFEYDHYLSRNTYSYIHLDAIYKGLESGFMDLFLGIGYEPIQTHSFKLFTKFGAGASGGRVEREGGFTIYPSIGIEQNLYKNISFQLHTGYIFAPFGNFQAYTIGYGIKYNTYNSGIYHKELNNKAKVTTNGIRLTLQNQTYFQAASTQVKPYDLQLIVVEMNRDISKHIYMLGQAAFTYEGEAGGYADGMVGLGYYFPKIWNDKIEFAFEFLAGVSGGAKIDTGAGFAIKPNVGMNYILNKKFNITSNIGKIIAPYGNLNSNIIGIGFSYNFAQISVSNQ